MKCPFCSNSETQVVDKRDTEDEKTTRRRRECLKCKNRFTTYERLELTNLIVIKKDGHKESFDRNKIKVGILKACQKRLVTDEQIEKVLNNIEIKLKDSPDPEIKSKDIGELVIKELKKLDKVAYIRFASVYKDFTDVESFEEELKKLKR
ncbi:MAG: transcriptional repressor NrdR [Candidatus Woesearchaeota archaeon]|nr:MAG: transcriptional repressor NrdR [Candidatus Woesearchaeota archaeon]